MTKEFLLLLSKLVTEKAFISEVFSTETLLMLSIFFLLILELDEVGEIKFLVNIWQKVGHELLKNGVLDLCQVVGLLAFMA